MRVVTRTALILSAALAVSFLRCGSDPGERETATRCGGELPPLIYVGQDYDEAAEALWDRRCQARHNAAAARLVEPAPESAVGGEPPPTIRWEQTLVQAPPAPRAAPRRGPARFLPRLSFGIEKALAHGPPLIGWGYLIELRPAAGEPVWIFASQKTRSWEMDRETFARLGTGRVKARITSAYFNQNIIEEGPWIGDEVSFHVEAGED